MSLPTISPGQRAVVAGRTGSGKSTLGKWLLLQSPGHWIILNPKWTRAYDNLPDSVKVKGFDLPKIEREITNHRFVVVDPKQVEATPDIMDLFVQHVHDHFTNIGLVADELYTLHKNGKAGDGLLSLLTRGRELKQSFIGLTQRPAWLSQFVFSESNYIAEMSLNLAADRKRMYEFIGHEKALEKLPPYEWLWYSTENDSLRYFLKVPL
jgi:hypothetical protein